MCNKVREMRGLSRKEYRHETNMMCSVCKVHLCVSKYRNCSHAQANIQVGDNPVMKYELALCAITGTVLINQHCVPLLGLEAVYRRLQQAGFRLIFVMVLSAVLLSCIKV